MSILHLNHVRDRKRECKKFLGLQPTGSLDFLNQRRGLGHVAERTGDGGLHLAFFCLEAASLVRWEPHTLHPVSWTSSSEILVTPAKNSLFLEFSLFPILRLAHLSSRVTNEVFSSMNLNQCNLTGQTQPE